MTSTNRLTWICGTLILPLLLIDGGAVANQLYSEGGSFMVQDDRSPSQESRANENTDYFAEEQTQYQQQMDMQNALEEAKRQRLAKIVAQLEQENRGGQKMFGSENDGASERRNSNIAANEWDVLKEMVEGEEEETPEVNLETSSKKLAAVKKGQNEFVEFVEPMPKPNNRHKTPEWMEKRIPYESGHNSNHFKFFTNSGNILFMAYLVVCCAGIVAATVGGVYYYNQVRANRIDDPFNEFTRYSPAGPGKDKLKKSGSPTFGQNGDDTLAYKTQLHHYQQQKQKILGNSPGGVIENISDNEEDTDEMDHNYSVFECPGLAPTGGDLEIQNPNFMGAGKPDPSQRRAD